MPDLESKYQTHVISRLLDTFPGCMVIKNDTQYIQGIPDLLLLHRDKWAMLEVKASQKARAQPNQGYYINLLNSMSFAAFIFPENEDEVFDGIQSAFSS